MAQDKDKNKIKSKRLRDALSNIKSTYDQSKNKFRYNPKGKSKPATGNGGRPLTTAKPPATGAAATATVSRVLGNKGKGGSSKPPASKPPSSKPPTPKPPTSKPPTPKPKARQQASQTAASRYPGATAGRGTERGSVPSTGGKSKDKPNRRGIGVRNRTQSTPSTPVSRGAGSRANTGRTTRPDNSTGSKGPKIGDTRRIRRGSKYVTQVYNGTRFVDKK